MKFSNNIKIVIYVLLVMTSTFSMAATRVWTGDGTNPWSDAGSWSPSGVPGSSDDVYIHNGISTGPIVDTAGNLCNSLMIAVNSYQGNILVVDGGELTVAGTSHLAASASSCNGVIDIEAGGKLKYDAGMFLVSYYSTGTATINVGGTFEVFTFIFPHSGTATLNIQGGQADVNEFYLGYNSGSYGTVNIYEGAIDVLTDFVIGENGGDGKINITQGSLYLPGDWTANATLLEYIDENKIVAYDGTDPLKIIRKEYDSTTEKTRVYAYSTSANAASQPNPADYAVEVPVDASLSWTAGQGVVSHNVYFGTDSDNLAQVSFHQTSTTYTPVGMEYGVTYYWRIDEYLGSSTVTGTLWRFSTIAPVCTPPLAGDLNGDCAVNAKDLALIAEDWATCTAVPQEACFED